MNFCAAREKFPPGRPQDSFRETSRNCLLAIAHFDPRVKRLDEIPHICRAGHRKLPAPTGKIRRSPWDHRVKVGNDPKTAETRCETQSTNSGFYTSQCHFRVAPRR